ncbi:hypothetical protein ACEOWG_000559 [Bacillus cereus]
MLSSYASKGRGFGDCGFSCRKCSQKGTGNENLELSVIGDILVISLDSKGLYKEVTLQDGFVNLIKFESLKAMHVKHKNKSDAYTVVVYEDNQVVFKECDTCGIVKHISGFYGKKRGIGGKIACCRGCRNRLIIKKEKKGQSIEMKRCSKSDVLKPLADYKDGKGVGNKDSICIACNNKWHGQYRTDNKRKISERKKRSYRNNTVGYKERARNYYKDNKDLRKQRIKLWSQNNPVKVAAYRLNRIAKKEVLLNTLTGKELEEILDDFEGLCALSRRNKIQLNHFICLASGHGGTYKGNIIPLNASLNARKYDINPLWCNVFIANTVLFK